MDKKTILILGDSLIENSFYQFFNKDEFHVSLIDMNKKSIQNYLEEHLVDEINKSFIVIVTKKIRIKEFLSIENIFIKYNCEILYINSFFNNLIVGPLRKPDEEGCLECFYYRWFRTKKDRNYLYNLKDYYENNQANDLSGNNITISLLELAANLTQQLITNMHKHSVYIIEKDTLKFNMHKFLPNSTCKICNNQQKDTKELVNNTIGKEFIEIENRNLDYRSLSKNELEKSLKDNYLDTQLGIFNTILEDYESPFAVSVANLPLEIGKDEVGVGRTNNYSDSKLTAMLEGLERYCGMEPRGKKTILHSSYDELGATNAIDPIELGIHHPSQYALPNFPFKKFDRFKKMNWVWGYSLTQKRPILVPETYAYYGLNYRDGVQNSFVYEISNGCALGGNILEAVLHAIFEIVERDAFLITWYTKLPLQKIQIDHINNLTIRLMIARFENLTGYKISLFDMTLDSGIPSVWAVARNSKNEGLNILCSAGCHLNREKAIENSLHELCGILIAMQGKFEKRKDELKKMVKDFSLVKHMEDHSLLFGLRELEFEFDFLLEDRKAKDLKRFDSIEFTNNLSLDLIKVIQKFIDIGLDIIVVDQSAPELDISNLKCVKVIIPGMLPMTFGHDMRRIFQLPRLFNVPEKMGHKIANKNELLNNFAIPHPFP